MIQVKLQHLRNEKKRRYLDSIAKDIARDDKVSVDLLIGANCIQVLEPIEPYALQTILGWCIVGPIECTSGKVGAVSYNRIAVNETGTNKIQSHYLEVQDQVKERGIKEIFQRMYLLDFNESSENVRAVMTKKLEDISYEDKTFLKLMDDKLDSKSGQSLSNSFAAEKTCYEVAK